MAFKLYKNDPADPPRVEVSFDDLQNKPFWCRLGESKELAFVDVMSKLDVGYRVIIHPEKATNPFHPDLELNYQGRDYIAEVKIKNSPLFFARTYDVDPQYVLTMDVKDSFNYNKLLKEGIDLFIFAWVNWEAHEMVCSHKTYRVLPMHDIWVTRFSKLRELETSNNPPGIHWYNESFRQPPTYINGMTSEPDKIWCAELIEFDSRLKTGGMIRNITADGHYERNGELYPTGQSSCSYVFDLTNQDIFKKVTA